MTRDCLGCTATFTPSPNARRTRLYCSTHCGNQFKHRGYRLDRPYERPAISETCSGCTAAITQPENPGPPKRWCSGSCRGAYLRTGIKLDHPHPKANLIPTPAQHGCGHTTGERKYRVRCVPCQHAHEADQRDLLRVCRLCEKPLLTGRKDSRLCSKACKMQWDARQRDAAQLAEYRRRNAEAIRTYQLQRRIPRTCTVCGTEWLTLRADAQYCSAICHNYTRFGYWPSSPLPSPPEERTCTCAWCDTPFTTLRAHQAYCTTRCSDRAHRARRYARAASAPGSYTWAEVIRLYLTFDRCCAYCLQPIEGQPDPDHVIPLSRGGPNTVTNLLPACRACNCDKRDLLLSEWNEDRALRGLEPRTTTWAIDDPRVHHLTVLGHAAEIARTTTTSRSKARHAA